MNLDNCSNILLHAGITGNSQCGMVWASRLCTRVSQPQLLAQSLYLGTDRLKFDQHPNELV